MSPKFLVKKFIEEENKKLEIEFLDLNKFYKKKKILAIMISKNLLMKMKIS